LLEEKKLGGEEMRKLGPIALWKTKEESYLWGLRVNRYHLRISLFGRGGLLFTFFVVRKLERR